MVKIERVFQAVRLNEPEDVLLLDEIPDINVKNTFSQNLLHEAVSYKNTRAFSKLIERGIDVNAQDSDGLTPLHYACEQNNLILARAILTNGGQVNISDKHGNTPLWTAVFNAKGNYDMIALLVEFGGSQVTKRKNNYGKSPFDLASEMGDSGITKLLSSSCKTSV